MNYLNKFAVACVLSLVAFLPMAASAAYTVPTEISTMFTDAQDGVTQLGGLGFAAVATGLIILLGYRWMKRIGNKI